MVSFRLGLFVGVKLRAHPRDNLDLERWFCCPKSHERRIHGHRHAAIRIVCDGPTLLPTLDAHASHPGVFSREDLFPFRFAQPPTSQLESQQRHVIVRKSRSKTTTHLAERPGAPDPSKPVIKRNVVFKTGEGWGCPPSRKSQ
jgi:hypothetical protein